MGAKRVLWAGTPARAYAQQVHPCSGPGRFGVKLPCPYSRERECVMACISAQKAGVKYYTNLGSAGVSDLIVFPGVANTCNQIGTSVSALAAV